MTSRYKLENDPECGVTTGGREDCFWDCEIESQSAFGGAIITNPACLLDCFPEVHIHIMFLSLIGSQYPFDFNILSNGA